jgi:hypothetical protein
MGGIDGIGVDNAEPMGESIVIAIFTALVFAVSIVFTEVRIIIAVVAIVVVVALMFCHVQFLPI